MAAYPTALREALARLDKDYQNNRRDFVRAAVCYAAAERVVNLTSSLIEMSGEGEFKNPRIATYLDWPNVLVRVDVKSFRAIQPLLDFVEAQGFAFVKTDDLPSWGERKYYAKPLGEEAGGYAVPGITVEAKLIDKDGVEGCKRIITGYTTPDPQPVYAFDCGEPGVTAPGAPATGEEAA